MVSRIPFIVFVACSALLHAGLLTLVPRPVAKTTQPQRTIEVAYQGHLAPPEESAPPDAAAPPPREDPLEKNTRAIAEFIKKDILKIAERPPEERPFAPKTQKSVSMPTIPGEMLKTPEYRSYYSLVREKIRKYAYFYYRKLEVGDVYLTFTLTPDGELCALVIDDAASSPNDYLKDIARQSVREAAPYPPFPQKLKVHKELAFNVIIDFELK